MKTRLVLVLAALLGIVSQAGAQAPRARETQGIAATITVVDPPLDLTGTRALRFGGIAPGTGPVTILPRDIDAGEGRGTGADGYRSLTFRLTLPAALTGPGGATIPLDFNGAYAGTCEINNSNQCDAASFQTWNPTTEPTHVDTPRNQRAGRYLYPRYSVYIGGRALPTATQRAGVYNGAIGVLVILN